MAHLLRWARLLNVLLLFDLVLLPQAEGQGSTDAFSVSWDTETGLLGHLREKLDLPASADRLPLLRHCISNSWWSAAKEVISRAHVSANASEFAAIRAEVTDSVSGVKRQADTFFAKADSTLREHAQNVNEVHCALQWAQNSTAVLLAVKYAARWSAPGAIEVVDVRVNMTPTHFELEGFGHHSQVRKRYVVDFELFAEILPTMSSWSVASVGRMTATLRKAVPGSWYRLPQSKGKLRNPITKWMDMQEKWNTELSTFKAGPNKSQDNTTQAKPPPAPSANSTKARRKGAKDKGVVFVAEKMLRKAWKRVFRYMPVALRPLVEDPVMIVGLTSLYLLLALYVVRACCCSSSRHSGASASEEQRLAVERVLRAAAAAKSAEERLDALKQKLGGPVTSSSTGDDELSSPEGAATNGASATTNGVSTNGSATDSGAPLE